MSKPQRYLLKTLGCKANYYDSLLIEKELQKKGWMSANASTQEAVLCIINTCTVTDEADRQSRKLASRLSRENPQAKIVVTGCVAEVDPERLSQSKGIYYVVGNRDKPRLVQMVLDHLKQQSESNNPKDSKKILGNAKGYEAFRSRHPMDREWPDLGGSLSLPVLNQKLEASRTRAFLKIQEGCNRFCTFCIIPYARGPSRSFSRAEVIANLHELCAQGTREVVLTGTNLGDFGIDYQDGESLLLDLLKEIFQKTPIERLRLSSLDPTEISIDLLKLLEREPRLCPHFHVSLQSPHSRILRLMKRPYSWNEVQTTLQAIANTNTKESGGVFIGMDIIAGFPSETAEEFALTCQALEQLPWSRLHVFPFSERKGTPATRLPNALSLQERERRAKILREISFYRLLDFYQSALKQCQLKEDGVLHHVLVEGESRIFDGSSGYWSGYTRNYLRVFFKLKLEKNIQTLQNQMISLRPRQIISDFKSGDVAFLCEFINKSSL